jgi:hypothetical protein
MSGCGHLAHRLVLHSRNMSTKLTDGVLTAPSKSREGRRETPIERLSRQCEDVWIDEPDRVGRPFLMPVANDKVAALVTSQQ